MSTGARVLDEVFNLFSPCMDPPPLSNPQAKQDDLSVVPIDEKDERNTTRVSSQFNHNTTAHEALSMCGLIIHTEPTALSCISPVFNVLEGCRHLTPQLPQTYCFKAGHVHDKPVIVVLNYCVYPTVRRLYHCAARTLKVSRCVSNSFTINYCVRTDMTASKNLVQGIPRAYSFITNLLNRGVEPCRPQYFWCHRRAWCLVCLNLRRSVIRNSGYCRLGVDSSFLRPMFI